MSPFSNPSSPVQLPPPVEQGFWREKTGPMILLVNPPLVKPSEPPPGIARLNGALSASGLECTVLDLNIEAILHLLQAVPLQFDKWSLRAIRNRDRNLAAIRNDAVYLDTQRYKRTVNDLNRLLEISGNGGPDRISLCNYGRDDLSPVRSEDLIRSAEEHWKNLFYSYYSRRLTDVLERNETQIVGFSLNFLSQALTAFSMAGFIRERFPHVKIALGGGLVTSWLRNPHWRNPFTGLVDCMIDGPGEHALLVMAGREGVKTREKRAELVPPVFPGGAELPDRPAHCRFHVPDYTDFPVNHYFSPGFILPYSASSGCYWNRCAFCPETAEGTPYEPVGPSEAVRQAAGLVQKMQPSLVHFLDSAVSPALLQKISENPPGAPWYGFVRFTRRLSDEDFCRKLKKSGCVMLKLGLESGDQGVIDMEGKGIDLAIASKALASLKNAGIGTYVYLLFGTPSESEKEARNTLDFTVRHSRLIDFLNLAIFNMPINSPDARHFGTAPHYGGDLSLYTGFDHPKGWDRGKVRHFLDREFKRHPAITPIVAKDPPFFTSNHAPFFHYQGVKR